MASTPPPEGTAPAPPPAPRKGSLRRLLGWSAPLARALRGSSVGDLRRVTLPGGEKEWEVLEIAYPEEIEFVDQP